MRKLFFIMCLVMLSVSAFAQRKNETQNPIVGCWKFTNQSVINDFQKVFLNKCDYQTQYFTFESNHKFKHDFLDSESNLVKSMKGKWKLSGNKIKIEYANIDYDLLVDYFFIDKDLVLGMNFNHVVFVKNVVDFQNMASK